MICLMYPAPELTNNLRVNDSYLRSVEGIYWITKVQSGAVDDELSITVYLNTRLVGEF
jgi:hypothetical protein